MNKIIVFVKAPVPGEVKTRSCPPLSAKQASDLYRAFVKDTLSSLTKIPQAHLEIAYAANARYPDLGWLNDQANTPFFSQWGIDLGSRLVHAFDHAFKYGAKKAVVVGSDTPHLDPKEIEGAFRMLNERDIVLGPATDGGYYLVGLTKPCPDVFKGISWSTSQVFQQTLERIKQNGLALGLLPRYRDMDTFADLDILKKLSNNGRIHQLRFTSKALRSLIAGLVLLVFVAFPAPAQTLALLSSSAISGSEGLPKGWEMLAFKKIKNHTHYEWAPETHAIHAVSSAAASGLIYRLDQETAKFPILRWRWRILHTIPKGDEKSKEGDDYAVRVYVSFRYDPSKAGMGTRIKYALAKTIYGEYPPHAGINYIWANRLPQGESTPNAYTNRVMMMALHSGNTEAGTWISEERNIIEDYRKLFKQDPPALSGIAIMTDTDNTGSQAQAWYADIELGSTP